jgi:O-antigen/teichoic acid export membrane protein
VTLKERILALFEDSAFRAPVLKLLSGTGVAFVIAYLANIVLMRLFPDEFWGVADYVTAWVSILAPVASLRYEDALMLPKDRRKSAHAYLLAVSSVLLFCTLLLLVLSFSDTVMGFFANKGGRWMLILPMAILANRLAKISEIWLSRHDAFGRMSLAQIVQSGSMVSVRIGSGLVSPGPGGLIWGFVIGFGLSFLSMSRHVVRTLRESLAGMPSLKEMVGIASRYRRFPQFTMPAALISGLITRLPILFIPEFFGMAVLGQYSRGFSILFIPLSMLAASIAQVFFVRAVEANRSGNLATFSGNVHSRLVLMAFWPTAVLMVAGGDIFATLFGEVWREGASYMIYVAPWIMLTTVASPLTRLFDVLERQRLELLITLLSLVVISAALFIGGQSSDIRVLLMFLGIGGAAVRFGQIIWLLSLAGCQLRTMLSPYVRYLLIGAPLLGLVWASSMVGIPLLTTAAGTLCGLAFLGIVFHRENLI